MYQLDSFPTKVSNFERSLSENHYGNLLQTIHVVSPNVIMLKSGFTYFSLEECYGVNCKYHKGGRQEMWKEKRGRGHTGNPFGLALQVVWGMFPYLNAIFDQQSLLFFSPLDVRWATWCPCCLRLTVRSCVLYIFVHGRISRLLSTGWSFLLWRCHEFLLCRLTSALTYKELSERRCKVTCEVRFDNNNSISSKICSQLMFQLPWVVGLSNPGKFCQTPILVKLCSSPGQL